MNSIESYFRLINAAGAISHDGTGGFSSSWRKNLSPLEALELANVLRALRKVAGFIGDNVGSIDWLGMSSKNARGSIVLDPEFAMGMYPVPYQKFDILVGIVVHEALHQVVWSERVWGEAQRIAGDTTPLRKLILSKIIGTGEDIYVDLISQKSVLGLYTAKIRKIAIERLKTTYDTAPSIDELLNIWWDSATGNLGLLFGQTQESAYRQELERLGSINEELLRIANSGQSVTDRCGRRAELYLVLWEDICDRIRPWKIFDRTMQYCPSDSVLESSGGRKPSRGGAPVIGGMDEIEVHLAADSTDITPLIRAVVGNDDEVIPTSLWDFDVVNTHPMIDPHLVARLRRIFEVYAERGHLTNRGLTSGKIDPRRLHKAAIDGKCFKEKQPRSEASWNIALLIDASASMRGLKWRMVENTVAAIFTALKGTNNHLQAFGYFEIDNICMISRLIKDRKLLSLYPTGKTASGQAIIGAALQMERSGSGKRLLIHVTDGGSNCGCDVKYGISYCKSKEIDLVTLGSGSQEREVMLEQYGDSIRFLDFIEKLPGVIEGLLRKKVLGS